MLIYCTNVRNILLDNLKGGGVMTQMILIPLYIFYNYGHSWDALEGKGSYISYKPPKCNGIFINLLY